jgi:hypothetical protein
MSDVANKAVFLSYASQDAEAAQRLAEALRTAGVEVWFDQNELVGGDAWDAKIRGQIASCALFVPVISANTRIGSSAPHASGNLRCPLFPKLRAAMTMRDGQNPNGFFSHDIRDEVAEDFEVHAAIACWDTKYTYDFWRPVTAIQNADQDGNDATVQDANWTPLLLTPPHPTYVSGHSTFSRAAAEVMTRLTGSAYFPGGMSQWVKEAGALEVEAGPSTDVVLQAATYYDAADQAGISRLYGGIHIVWDRLFDTYQRESQRVRYGLTHNISTFNPLRIASHEYRDMLRDVARSTTWRERLGHVFAHPGWGKRRRHDERWELAS